MEVDESAFGISHLGALALMVYLGTRSDPVAQPACQPASQEKGVEEEEEEEAVAATATRQRAGQYLPNVSEREEEVPTRLGVSEAQCGGLGASFRPGLWAGTT